MKCTAIAGAVSVIGIALISFSTIDLGAQHTPVQSRGRHAAPNRPPSGDLPNIVREATARFKDVAVAEAEGYSLMFGCVSSPEWGAMGLHYVNMSLVTDGKLDPAKPEIVIYEPLPEGRLRLIGADYLIFADAWHASSEGTPQLAGQLMHLIESPNRYGLPDFYTLHVWAWKNNPAGTFSNWHSNVACNAFSPAK